MSVYTHACVFLGRVLGNTWWERRYSGLWHRDTSDLEQIHRCVLAVLMHLLATLGSALGHHGLSLVTTHRTLVSPAFFIVLFPFCKCKVAPGTLPIS